MPPGRGERDAVLKRIDQSWGLGRFRGPAERRKLALLACFSLLLQALAPLLPMPAFAMLGMADDALLVIGHADPSSKSGAAPADAPSSSQALPPCPICAALSAPASLLPPSLPALSCPVETGSITFPPPRLAQRVVHERFAAPPRGPPSILL